MKKITNMLDDYKYMKRDLDQQKALEKYGKILQGLIAAEAKSKGVSKSAYDKIIPEEMRDYWSKNPVVEKKKFVKKTLTEEQKTQILFDRIKQYEDYKSANNEKEAIERFGMKIKQSVTIEWLRHGRKKTGEHSFSVIAEKVPKEVKDSWAKK